MKTLSLKKKKINKKDFTKRSAIEQDFSELIREPFLLEDDGLKLAYLELPNDSVEVLAALRNISYGTSKRSDGLLSSSTIFGFMPRRIAFHDYCRAADLSRRSPEEHQAICGYAKNIASAYKSLNPALYEKHLETVSKVRPGWMLDGTPFTSGIANKDNQLKYHFDAGNFPGTWSCMIAFKHNVEGGYLSLPEYGIGIEIADKTLLMFDGQETLHGVTPIHRLSSDSYRFTVVYYSLQQMWRCEEPKAELERIKRVKTEREFRRTNKEELNKALWGKKAA